MTLKKPDRDVNDYVPCDYKKESQKARDKAVQKVDSKTTAKEIGLYVKKVVEIDEARSFWADSIEDFKNAIKRILNF